MANRPSAGGGQHERMQREIDALHRQLREANNRPRTTDHGRQQAEYEHGAHVAQSPAIAPLIPQGTIGGQSYLMSTLLRSLHLSTEDMDMRPHLTTCVRAAGYDTTYPFGSMACEPMDMDLAGFLDKNYATNTTRA